MLVFIGQRLYICPLGLARVIVNDSLPELELAALQCVDLELRLEI